MRFSYCLVRLIFVSRPPFLLGRAGRVLIPALLLSACVATPDLGRQPTLRSVDSIAGICNEAGNVVGLMPHPERASEALLGSVDGVVLLRSFLGAAAGVSSSPTARSRPA